MKCVTYQTKPKIDLYGSESQIDALVKMLDQYDGNFTDEGKSRLAIQELLNKENYKGCILVNGNSVYSSKPIVNEFKKHLTTGYIGGMSKLFYDFCTLPLGEIAHYDIDGFIAYFGGKFENLYNEVWKNARLPGWDTDAQKILDECKALYEDKHKNTVQHTENEMKYVKIILESVYGESKLTIEMPCNTENETEYINNVLGKNIPDANKYKWRFEK